MMLNYLKMLSSLYPVNQAAVLTTNSKSIIVTKHAIVRIKQYMISVAKYILDKDI